MKKEGIAADSEKKVSAILAAVSGNRRELFALPLDDEPGTDVDGGLEADAGAGRGSIFHGGGLPVGSSCGIFPGNLGDCPQDRSWFEVAAVHAMFIGRGVGWISYQRMGLGEKRRFPDLKRFRFGNVVRERRLSGSSRGLLWHLYGTTEVVPFHEFPECRSDPRAKKNYLKSRIRPVACRSGERKRGPLRPAARARASAAR